MDKIQFLLINFFHILLISLSFYVSGRPFLHVLNFDNLKVLKRLVLSSLLGIVSLSFFTFILGIFGLINKYFILLFLLVSTLISVKLVTTDIKETILFFKSEKQELTELAILLLIIFIPLFIISLYPPYKNDEISYHLAVVKQYISSHSITPTIYLRYAVFPRNIEMLFLDSMLFFNDISSHLVSLLMIFYAVMIIFTFSKSIYSKNIAVLSISLFTSNPIILWLGTVAYIDAGLILFSAISILILIYWINNNDNKWLTLSAIFLGFSAGVKYTALFFIFLAYFIVLYNGFTKKAYKNIVTFLILTAIFASPWYIFNYYYTGNPFWPFLYKIFGIKIWDVSDIKGQILDLFRNNTIKKSILTFVELPKELIFKNWRSYPFLTEVPKPLSLPFIISSFSSFLLFFTKRGETHTKLILLISFSYILFWFSTAPLIRYLTPVIPLLSISASIFIERILSMIKLNRRIVILILFLLISLNGFDYIKKVLTYTGFPPATKKTVSIFLASHIPSYKAFKWLNEKNKGKQCTVYSLLNEIMAYYSREKFKGDWFGPARYSEVFKVLNDEDKLCLILSKKFKSKYFVVNYSKLKHLNKRWYNNIMKYTRKKGCLNLIYKDKYNLIFEIHNT